MRTRTLLLASAALLAACADEPMSVAPTSPASPSSPTITDEIVGVSLALPTEWSMSRDPVLFNDSYGFLIWGEDRDPSANGPHDREPIARIALVHDASPDQIPDLARAQIRAREMIPGLELSRSEVEVGDGLRGVAVTGMMGARPYSVVYVASGNRVYEIGLWTDEPGLDTRAHLLLGSLRFTAPTRSVQSLGLRDEKESLHWEPTGEIALLNQAAQAERKRAAMADVRAGLLQVGPHTLPTFETEPMRARAPSSMPISRSESAGCGVWAPYGTQMQWQTQWDNSNTFYPRLFT